MCVCVCVDELMRVCRCVCVDEFMRVCRCVCVSLTAVQFEHQFDGEVIEEAAVQDERDEGRQAALPSGGAGLGPVSIQLAEHCGYTHTHTGANTHRSKHTHTHTGANTHTHRSTHTQL